MTLCYAMTAGGAEPAKDPAHGPGQALERLRQGNRVFQTGQIDVSRASAERRSEVAGGQHPFAIVLSCADSRVPPEILFNQGLGDLFVVRVAGAVADQAVLGSLEYGAEHLHAPLVVVMGHSSCGAVKAAMESPAPAKPDPAGANLERILSAIRPGLARALPGADKWTSAVYASVERNIQDVVRLSPVLAEMGEAGKVALVAAFYDLSTGQVHFSAPVAVRHGARPSVSWKATSPHLEAHK